MNRDCLLRTARILLATLPVWACLSGAAQAASTPMKIAHLVPGEAPRGQGAELMAKEVSSDDRCNIDARVFPNSQLGGTTDLIENLQTGALEVAILPGSFLVGFQPLIGIMDFPYFWPTDYNDLKTVIESDAMRALLDTTEEKGVVSLSVWHTGYKSWTANKPLDTVAAYKGLKARVMPSAIIREQDKLLGMQPVAMPFSETYVALQNGAIDTQENPVVTNYLMRFQEVQDYLTLSNHGTLDQVIMVSKLWWDKLDDGCQTAVREAVADGGDLTAELVYKMIDEKALPAIRESGTEVVEVSDENFAAMRDQVLPGVKQFYIQQNGDRGKAIVDAFEDAFSNL
ncbi:MAG: TRAP transporter substrate-binding protein [Alcanivorax sp.]|nr:TRAP transporter substrate-binding protein [Alcanivorax sp.]